jgi:hypothetical protein
MLRLNRRLLGVAAAVVFAASLAVTGATAASATPALVSGTLSVQIVSTSATSPTESVITHGLFTDYGVDYPGNTVDKIVLQKGSFKVAHSAGVGPQSFNPQTCLLLVDQHGTYKIYRGTGKYRGISGSGTYHFTLTQIAARVNGKCSQTAPPVASQLIINASGPVSLP